MSMAFDSPEDEAAVRSALMLPEQDPAVRTTTERCAAHKYHAPAPTYCEVHHWIPRAWQQFWTPPGSAPFPGSYAGQRLWDARTIPLCRTGHGNVHTWIVTMMMRHEPGFTPEQLVTAVRFRYRAGRLDLGVAREALIRFEAAGGDLGALTAAGLWGEI